METKYVIAWFVVTLILSIAIWRPAGRIPGTAWRGLLRTFIPAAGLAAIPSPHGWFPAALYFMMGRDFIESLGISLISIGVLWAGLFALYWLVLVYQDALFGDRRPKH